MSKKHEFHPLLVPDYCCAGVQGLQAVWRPKRTMGEKDAGLVRIQFRGCADTLDDAVEGACDVLHLTAGANEDYQDFAMFDIILRSRRRLRSFE